MATPEHGLYCFESLAAKLDKTLTPFSLTDVQDSYAAYLAHLQDPASTTTSPPKKLPALARLTDASSSSSSLSSSGASSSSSTISLSTSTAATSINTPPTPRDRITDPEARFPLFVTWDKAHPASSSTTTTTTDPSPDWHLRGCIGTFAADDPLTTSLAEYATIAALHDTRFSPITRAELPALRCAVTLLTNFEPCAAWDDWDVGVHGIKIKFRTAGARGASSSYSGTYLPSVAAEQGWSKEETLLSLMRKAGWRGPRDQWLALAADADCMQVERYRGDKEEVEFAEYEQWRAWACENWGEGDGR